jgi:hypothetical protein
MVSLTVYEGVDMPMLVSAVDSWFAAECADSRSYLDQDAALNRFTAEYYSRMVVTLEATFTWVRDRLPEPLQERLIEDQSAWLRVKRTRFAALNVLYGLLGGGRLPFDHLELLLAHTAVIKARALEIEAFYETFRAHWRSPALSLVH